MEPRTQLISLDCVRHSSGDSERFFYSNSSSRIPSAYSDTNSSGRSSGSMVRSSARSSSTLVLLAVLLCSLRSTIGLYQYDAADSVSPVRTVY